MLIVNARCGGHEPNATVGSLSHVVEVHPRQQRGRKPIGVGESGVAKRIDGIGGGGSKIVEQSERMSHLARHEISEPIGQLICGQLR